MIDIRLPSVADKNVGITRADGCLATSAVSPGEARDYCIPSAVINRQCEIVIMGRFSGKHCAT